MWIWSPVLLRLLLLLRRTRHLCNYLVLNTQKSLPPRSSLLLLFLFPLRLPVLALLLVILVLHPYSTTAVAATTAMTMTIFATETSIMLAIASYENSFGYHRSWWDSHHEYACWRHDAAVMAFSDHDRYHNDYYRLLLCKSLGLAAQVSKTLQSLASSHEVPILDVRR